MILISLMGREARQHVEALDKAAWNSPEERQQAVKAAVDSGLTPHNFTDIIQRSYHESNKKRQAEKLAACVEGLLLLDKEKVSEAVMKSLPRMMNAQSKRAAFKVLTVAAVPSIEKQLAELIKHKDQELRDGAEKVLIAQKTATACAIVKEMAMKKSGWEDRRPALRILQAIGGNDVLPSFQVALDYGKHEDIPTAVTLLVQRGNEESAAILANSASHESPFVRAQVAEGLGKLKSASSAKGLVKLAQDENDRVQVAALKSLQNQEVKHISQNMTSLLEHPKAQVKLQVIKVLAMGEDESVIQPLITCLKDQDLLVRQEAMSALTSLSESGKIPIGKLLIGLMTEEDVNVRRSASEVLGKVRDKSVINDLLRYLRDEDWWVRESVAATLGEIGGEDIIDTMIELLGDKDPNIRRYAVDILAQNKAVKAFKPLTQLLKDSDWWIREKVVEALGSIGETKAVPLLVKLLQVPELRWAAVIALGELQAPDAADALMKLYAAETAIENRMEIMDSLQKIGGDKVLALMKKLLEDENKSIRLKARDYLNGMNVDTSKAEGAHLRKGSAKPLTQLDEMLLKAKEAGATDLFLAGGRKPMMKKHGEVLDLLDGELDADALEDMLTEPLDPEREKIYRETHDLDCAYETPLGDRFRVNMYRYRLGPAAVYRCIPDKVPTLDDLGFPPLLKQLTKLHQGIVLFTGPAASGKTTTMAAMVDYANQTRQDHILCIEDPIEYVHESRKCLVNQREVHTHTKAFANALRAALREDPDIIMVGELRDLETISMAISAAETGHLVFGSLHTVSSVNTLTRIIDAYPSGQQSQIRTMLSESVKGIISQQLVRKVDGGITAALEILVSTPSLSKQIRDGKMEQVQSTIMTGKSRGMQTMDMALYDMATSGVIDGAEAYRMAFNKKDFEQFVAGAPPAPAETNGAGKE